MTIKDNTPKTAFVFSDLKPGQAFRSVTVPEILWMKTVVSFSEDGIESFNAVDLNDGDISEFLGNEDVIVVNAEVVIT